MQRLNLKSIILTTSVLFIICAFVTAFLAGINDVTAPIIEEKNKENIALSCQQVLPEADIFEEIENGFKALDNSRGLIGYVFITQAKGYGGDISVMTGIDKNGKISGVSILSMDETPGLGANAKNESFTKQYSKNTYQTGAALSKDGGNIDALTGATITSQAVTDAVNDALEYYKSLKGGN